MTMRSFDEKVEDLKSTFEQCLKAPELFVDENEKELCRQMVESLPTDLVTYAANTSYAFWYLSLEPDSCPSEEVKVLVAMREARRHLNFMGGNYDKALKNFIESCEYRKEKRIDLLRVCFDESLSLSPEDETLAREMAQLVVSDLQKQYVVMRGHDRHNRTVMIRYPRTTTGTTDESYLMAQIYIAERSIAATEFLSQGAEQRSLAVYDYIGFDGSNAPPLQMQITAATLVQKQYPERLQTLVFVEPPFWLRGLFKIFNPFLSDTIKNRIKWASGVDERERVFQSMIDEKYAPPLLLKDGKLTTPVSLMHFLKDVPFYALYDDVKCGRAYELGEKSAHEKIKISSDALPFTQSVWNSIF